MSSIPSPGATRLALQAGNNTEALTRLRRAFQGMLGQLGIIVANALCVCSRRLPAGAVQRCSLLRLGRERIELLEFTDSAGRPYPPGSTSTDLRFQHMAIVVNDMTHAHQRVMANPRFSPISRNGPVRRPGVAGH